MVLTKALQQSEGKTANIYTESKYALLILHAHAALWKEQGLLTTEGSPIKHSKEMFHLLKSSFTSKTNSSNSLPWTSKVRGSGC
jgi:ribonuclease HI